MLIFKIFFLHTFFENYCFNRQSNDVFLRVASHLKLNLCSVVYNNIWYVFQKNVFKKLFCKVDKLSKTPLSS